LALPSAVCRLLYSSSSSLLSLIVMSTATPFPPTELSLLIEWADQEADMVVDIEELSATSFQEVSKVLEKWQSDHEDDDEDACISVSEHSIDNEDVSNDIDIMEIDEQLGANLLGDDVFGGPCCASPTGPLEELVLMSVDDDERFFAPLLEDDDTQDLLLQDMDVLAEDATATLRFSLSSLHDKKRLPSPFDEQYRETIKKLEESMRRSQETRKSLTMKTPKTEKYGRSKSVTGVLTSIENSSRQIQTYLQTVQRAV
jgi:hypothetical protein